MGLVTLLLNGGGDLVRRRMLFGEESLLVNMGRTSGGGFLVESLGIGCRECGGTL